MAVNRIAMVGYETQVKLKFHDMASTMHFEDVDALTSVPSDWDYDYTFICTRYSITSNLERYEPDLIVPYVVARPLFYDAECTIESAMPLTTGTGTQNAFPVDLLSIILKTNTSGIYTGNFAFWIEISKSSTSPFGAVMPDYPAFIRGLFILESCTLNITESQMTVTMNGSLLYSTGSIPWAG